MTTYSTDTAVRMSVVVDAPIDRAFSVFTDGIGDWFPPQNTLLEVEVAERVFEPRVGGQVYDRGVDGSECRWARVLAYEPPDRVVFTWDMDPQCRAVADLATTSEVEVRFVAETAQRTRVDVEHRNLDRHGEGWERARDALGGDGGWPGCMRRFAEFLSA